MKSLHSEIFAIMPYWTVQKNFSKEAWIEVRNKIRHPVSNRIQEIDQTIHLAIIRRFKDATRC